jgi:hypothetical protein
MRATIIVASILSLSLAARAQTAAESGSTTQSVIPALPPLPGTVPPPVSTATPPTATNTIPGTTVPFSLSRPNVYSFDGTQGEYSFMGTVESGPTAESTTPGSTTGSAQVGQPNVSGSTGSAIAPYGSANTSATPSNNGTGR